MFSKISLNFIAISKSSAALIAKYAVSSFLFAAIWSGLAYAQMGGSAVGSADYALINGKIYTVNEKQPWAEAVAIDGNKIVYVGDAAGLRQGYRLRHQSNRS